MAQHWVPKHILLGFADADGFVWAYDKTGQQPPKRIHAKVAAIGGGGQLRQNTDSVERLMASLEGAALPVIEALRRTRAADLVIDPVPKLIMAFYLEMLFSKRSPSLMDAQKYDAAKYLSCAPSIIEEWIRDSWWPSTLRRQLFHWMTWTILECQADVVAVSDRGLSWPRDVQNRDSNPLWRGMAGAAMLTPSSQFYLPLNRNRLLLVGWKGRPSDVVRVVEVSPAQVRRINGFSIDLSGRFVYSVKQPPSFEKFIQNPKLSNPLDLKLGDTNDHAKKLDYVRNYLFQKGLRSFDLELCLAPLSLDRKHSWQDIGMMPSFDRGDLEVSTHICEYCMGWKQLRTGSWVFNHFEAERQRTSDKEERMKNWWESVVIRDFGERIAMR